MFRTSGNSTTDGFAAIIFSNVFDKYFAPAIPARVSSSISQQIPEGRSHVMSSPAVASDGIDAVSRSSDRGGLVSTRSSRGAAHAGHQSKH
jgi:hypothetical protein